MRRFRLLATVAVILAALLTGRPSAHAATSVTGLVCGDVILSGSQWLQGHGVDVKSNGPNNFTGASCAGVSTHVPAVQYGYGFQCVELAARLYQQRGWGRVFAYGPASVGNFRYGAQYIPEGSPSLQFHPVSSSYQPVPGDLLIEGGPNIFGHVDVVDHVVSMAPGTTKIYAVEENASMTGFHTYVRTATTITGAYHIVRGFLHSPKNSYVNPPSTPTFKVTIFKVGSTMYRATALKSSTLQTPLAAESTPAVAATGSGSYDVAYVAPNQHVMWSDPRGTVADTGLVALADTSPAIAMTAADTPVIAVLTSAHAIAVWTPSATTNVATDASSTPALVLDGNDGFVVTYADSSGELHLATPSTTVDLGVKMLARTRPSLARLAGGSYEVAVTTAAHALGTVAVSSDFLLTSVQRVPVVTLLNVTSPTVAATASSYVVAYNAAGRPYVLAGGVVTSLALPTNAQVSSTPSVAAQDGGTYSVSYRGTDGRLWELTPSTAFGRFFGLSFDVAPTSVVLR